MAKVGKPLMFPAPSDIEAAIEAYFEETPEDEYTVTGLALALGTSRQVLVNYEKREEYRAIVQRAKCRVENSYELSLRKHGRAGDIFALKNFGWKDQQHIKEESTRKTKVAIDEESMPNVAAAVAKLISESR